MNNGSGDGSYEAGEVVTIVADAAPAGQEFDAWTGDVADPVNASTSITMPASDVIVSAGYKDISSDTTAPVFTSANTVSVEENQTAALTLTATDESAITYSLSGTDSPSFGINVISGLVTFNTAPDFEIKNSYSFTATATDASGNVATQSISIAIIDVDETVNDRSVINVLKLSQIAHNKGQTPYEYLVDQFDQTRPATFDPEVDQNIFDVSISWTTYSQDNWPSHFDFSGVAWNGIQAGTLITNQHIVLAAHFQRGVGTTVLFYPKDGSATVSRTIAATLTSGILT